MDTKEIIKTYSYLINEKEHLEINQIKISHLPKNAYQHCFFLFVIYFLISFFFN